MSPGGLLSAGTGDSVGTGELPGLDDEGIETGVVVNGGPVVGLVGDVGPALE
jgi:hypothetical protein